MLSQTTTAHVTGLHPTTVTVEVDLHRGKPQLIIIGLANQAVTESKERITAALLNCNITPKSRRTVVNLAPADIKKSGTSFDLAITLALLSAYGTITYDLTKVMIFGELSLDGNIKKVRGIIPLLIHAKQHGYSQVIIPQENQHEVSLLTDMHIYAVSHLRQLLSTKNIQELKTLHTTALPQVENVIFANTFEEIYEQQEAKRALEIAAAGGHNVLLTGPPGTGKSMLAQALVSILPPLEESESLSVNSIYSVAGLLENKILCQRPFRSPHHSISRPAMIGGGSNILPGELSLAHTGVLFMDEIPEFSKHILESLRQPLEQGNVSISRALGTVQYPCNCILIAASNPCPCGYKFSQTKACCCSQNQYLQYTKRISGPILDRIDLKVFVRPVATKDITEKNLQQNQTSSEMRNRVILARNRQAQRYQGAGILTNSQLSTKQIRTYCHLEPQAEQILKKSSQKYQFSTRVYFKLIKIAQTIADLEQNETIAAEYMIQALQYRKVDL